MTISEFDDAYEDQQRIRGAILKTSLTELPLRTPIVVQASDSVVKAVEAMIEHSTGCMLVERDAQLVGILTERDILTKVVFRGDGGSLKVEDVMTPGPETLSATATIAVALNKMSEGGYR